MSRRNGRILASILQSAASDVSVLTDMTLLERIWKYTALGVTSIIFEEANPILGGIAASSGRLRVQSVIVAVTLGTWIASIGLYYLGMWRIEWVRARLPGWSDLLDRGLDLVGRNPWRASLAVRFAYGLRLPLPISCGAARVPIGLYTIASGISCLVWSIAFVYVGVAAGDTALRLLEWIKQPEIRIGFVVLVAFAVIVTIVVRRRRARTNPI